MTAGKIETERDKRGDGENNRQMERVRRTEPEIIRGRGAPGENREGESHREVV